MEGRRRRGQSPLGKAKTERTPSKGDGHHVELRPTLTFVLGKGAFGRTLYCLFPEVSKSRRLHEEAAGSHSRETLIEAARPGRLKDSPTWEDKSPT